MTLSNLGSLVRENLETRAKNLLKDKIAKRECFQPDSNFEEINFLYDRGYITPKAGPPFLEYDITDEGREYVGVK